MTKYEKVNLTFETIRTVTGTSENMYLETHTSEKGTYGNHSSENGKPKGEV